MSRRHSAKYKIDRRVGENIWGRPKSPFNKRPTKPGQHGQRSLNSTMATLRKSSSAKHMTKPFGAKATQPRT